jgi:hypothetical protein
VADHPIFWTNEVWNGDPDGDITLEFDGYTWTIKKDIVAAQFPWIKTVIAETKPVSS